MARQRRATAAIEQGERVIEPCGDLLDAERSDACRRQLEGEWQTVEPCGDRGDGGRGAVRERERAARGPCAVDEQAHGVVVSDGGCRRGVDGGRREWRKNPCFLALDREGFATRRENR